MAAEQHKVRFETLDAWRGIAATAVALFHLVVCSHFSDIALVRHAWIFVDFFFVLSGFVITHAYFVDLQNHHSAGNFLLRRIGRLWPLHMLTLSVFVLFEFAKLSMVTTHYAAPQPLFSSETGTSIRQLIENVVLIQALGINGTNTWNGPSWSVSTELWAYVTFALVCLLPSRRLVTVAASVIVLISAAIVGRYAPNYMISSFDFGMPRCLYGFFVGHLVYRFWSSGRLKLGYPVVAEVAALVLVVLYVSVLQPDAWSLAAPLVFGVAIWVFAFEAGPVTTFMRNRAALSLGAWSYSIYMVHVFVVEIFEKAASFASRLLGAPVNIKMAYVPIGPPDNFIYFGNKWAIDLLVLFYLVLVLSLSSLTYRYFEQPGRRYFNRLART